MSEKLVLAAVKSTATAVDHLMGYISDLARIVRDCGDLNRLGVDLELIATAARCRTMLIFVLDRIECDNPGASIGNAGRIMMPRHFEDLGLDYLQPIPLDGETHDHTGSMDDMYRASQTVSSVSAQAPGFPSGVAGNIQLLVMPGQGVDALP